MARLVDSLTLRLALVIAAGVVVLQAAIAVVVLWPQGRPLVYRLPSPQDAAAMARAIEAAPPDVRPLVVEALDRGPLVVELAAGFPPEPPGYRGQGAARFPRIFARYGERLEGRPFRIQARQDDGERGPLRLVVGLRTGQVLIVQRSQSFVERLTGRAVVIAAAAAAVMLGVLAVSLWTVRPVGRLARAARGIADDVRGPDLPIRGVREVRALSASLNELRRRIRALLDDRTRMLAAIAHDMRTYLTRLRLRAEFIDDPDQRARAVADLEEMGELLDDTLLFARDATHPATAGPGRADVRAEIADLIARRRELGQSVEDLTAGDQAIAAAASPLSLRRMLDNLVDNAVRYGGRARLSAWQEGGEACIAVDDEGPGAPAAALERMTEPFERLEPSRGRDAGGAGLGLAIVRALAESRGGRLVLENRSEGGLRALVRLPSA